MTRDGPKFDKNKLGAVISILLALQDLVKKDFLLFEGEREFSEIIS